MGSTEPIFFEDDSVAERVSRRLLGTAETEGRPAKLTRFFRLCESAPSGPRGEGESETRDRRVLGRFPVGRGEGRRDLPCEAVAKTARRSTKTQLYFVTRFPSGKWLWEWRKNETKSIQRETNTTTREIEE